MSQCIECYEEMDPVDAQQFLECADCRKRLKRYRRVPTVLEPGIEDLDRAVLSTDAEDEDEYDNDREEEEDDL